MVIWHWIQLCHCQVLWILHNCMHVSFKVVDFCMVSNVCFDGTLKGLVTWHLAMKRLYIGGLGHTVSEKDLKDRFGKFGDVSDVEIITRKDEHGRNWWKPCLLNSTKWFNWFEFIYLHSLGGYTFSILNIILYYSGFVQYLCDLFAGSPLKTFGYININITDAEYKRCTCIYLHSIFLKRCSCVMQ